MCRRPWSFTHGTARVPDPPLEVLRGRVGVQRRAVRVREDETGLVLPGGADGESLLGLAHPMLAEGSAHRLVKRDGPAALPLCGAA